jgi:hypothetical protein
MVRLKLTTRQVAELRKVATASGINSSELLRRLLDSWIERRAERAKRAAS